MKPFLTFCVSSAFAISAAAQCTPSWSADFAALGVEASVLATCTFDDGSGPALYVGGTFVTAGPAPASYIARWTPSGGWSAVGGGMNNWVNALCVFDDGSGAALYATGYFTTAGGVTAIHIARWDGASWSPLGDGVDTPGGTSFGEALAVFDDGAGPALYVGGHFIQAGGAPARNIARWNGASWSAISSGLAGQRVKALHLFDDGSGSALYAGGDIHDAGGVAVRGIARWNGAAWSSVGTISTSYAIVHALLAFDDGSGSKLYATGAFEALGGAASRSVARWNGAFWEAVGSGLSIATPPSASPIGAALASFDDGSGAKLHLAGTFDRADGNTASSLARWTGTAWEAVGDGLTAPSGANFGYASGRTLCAHDLGLGPRLAIGGTFGRAGTTTASSIATFDGDTFAALPGASGANGSVRVFARHDDGAPGGPALYAGGDFTIIGGVAASRVARFDGVEWTALDDVGIGGGTNTRVNALCSHAGALFAAGWFSSAGGVAANNIARCDGSAWSALGSGTGSEVLALAVYDDGGGEDLYAAGYFTAAGGTPAGRIARWDGTAWSAVGTGPGFGSGFLDKVRSLCVYDSGSGPELYAGGGFAGVDFVAAPYFARWNGRAWSAVGAFVDKDVHDMVVHDDGSGAKLYFAGQFIAAGGSSVLHVGSWDGTSIQPVGGGIDWNQYAIDAFDDGTGPALYSGGISEWGSGDGTAELRRFDGATWTPVAGGFNGDAVVNDVLALAVYDGGGAGGPDLWIGGAFEIVSGAPSTFIAQRFGCAVVGTPFCFGDGSAAPCPCGNTSAPGAGEGCAHSLGTGGRIDARGVARISADSLVLVGTRMSSSAAVYIQGSAQQAGGLGVAFGDGLRCAGGSVLRLGTKQNVMGTSHFPGALDSSVSERGFVPAGATRHYQTWFRNAAAFCTSATFNLTNGTSVIWGA